MERVFVDTGGWFALVDSSDPAHRRAADWMDSNTLPLLTTDYVFDETVTLIRMELGHRIAVKFGEKLLASSMTQLASISPDDRNAAWQTFKRYRDQKLSFTDCSSFAVMRRFGIHRVLTTDHHFRVASFEVLL